MTVLESACVYKCSALTIEHEQLSSTVDVFLFSFLRGRPWRTAVLRSRWMRRRTRGWKPSMKRFMSLVDVIHSDEPKEALWCLRLQRILNNSKKKWFFSQTPIKFDSIQIVKLNKLSENFLCISYYFLAGQNKKSEFLQFLHSGCVAETSVPESGGTVHV